MSDEQLAKLTESLDRGFSTLSQRMGSMELRIETLATKRQVNSVYDLLDKNISEHEKQEQERAAMSHQIDRLTRHVEQLAQHTGVRLDAA
jgi:hypothetical protein